MKRLLLAGIAYLAAGLFFALGYALYEPQHPSSSNLSASEGFAADTILWPVAMLLEYGYWSAQQADQRRGRRP